MWTLIYIILILQKTKIFVAGGCGGYYTFMNDSFTSENYPSAYPVNSKCRYTILVPEGYSITLTFIDFHLEACCDFVLIIHKGQVRGTSVTLLNYSFPRNTGNFTIEICSGNCTKDPETCFTPSFQPKHGYFHQYNCEQKFSDLIMANVYDVNGNHSHTTLCESGNGRNNVTCLQNVSINCRLVNILEIVNTNNRFVVEMKLREDCHKAVSATNSSLQVITVSQVQFAEKGTKVVPIVLTVVGAAAFVGFIILIIFMWNKRMKNKTNPESAKEDIAADENGIPPVLRENTVHVNDRGGAPKSTNI